MKVRQVLAGGVLVGGMWASIASGSTSVNSTPSGGGSTTAAGAGAITTAAGPTTTAAAAHVGATISVKDENDHPESVNLVKVFNNATGADQFTQPDGGKRFVAVQFSITNNDTSASISPNPDFEGTLIDASNRIRATTRTCLRSAIAKGSRTRSESPQERLQRGAPCSRCPATPR